MVDQVQIRVLLGFIGGIVGAYAALKVLSVLPETSGLAAIALGYGAIWIPLLAAVAFVTSHRDGDSLCVSLGAKFRPIDILWGISVGLFLRVFASVVTVIVSGRLPSAAATLNAPELGMIYVLATFVAPIIITPVVEELFFRGLALKALFHHDSHRPPYRFQVLVGLISSTLFTVMHLTQGTSTTHMLVTGITVFGFGMATSVLSIRTRRLGGSIIAHAVFNALSIAS